jgi:hypothetical protein
MAPPSPGQIMVSVIQELQHEIKEYKDKMSLMYNLSLAMLVTKIT